MQQGKVLQHDSSNHNHHKTKVSPQTFSSSLSFLFSIMNGNTKPPKSEYSPAPPTFHLPRLPLELIIEIFQYAALAWLSSTHAFTPPTHFSTHLIVHKTPPYRYLSQEITPKSEYVNFAGRKIGKIVEIQAHNEALKTRKILPPLLHVDSLARGLMYDTILNANRQTWDPPLTPKTALYVEDCLNPSPPDFGLGIQNFRQPRLSKRVAAEDTRLAETHEQYTEEKKSIGGEGKNKYTLLQTFPAYKLGCWQNSSLDLLATLFFQATTSINTHHHHHRVFWEPMKGPFRPDGENLRWDYGGQEMMRLVKCSVHHRPFD